MRTVDQITNDMIKANQRISEARKTCRVAVEQTNENLLGLGLELSTAQASTEIVENTVQVQLLISQ